MATTDEVYLADEIKMEICRLLPNLIDEIASMRAVIAGGGVPTEAFMNAGARGMLGRLLRLSTFAAAEPTIAASALGVLAMTQSHLTARITALRNALRTFRDAAKSNSTETTSALNALEAAIPVQKRFLNQSLPTDW